MQRVGLHVLVRASRVSAALLGAFGKPSIQLRKLEVSEQSLAALVECKLEDAQRLFLDSECTEVVVFASHQLPDTDSIPGIHTFHSDNVHLLCCPTDREQQLVQLLNPDDKTVTNTPAPPAAKRARWWHQHVTPLIQLSHQQLRSVIAASDDSKQQYDALYLYNLNVVRHKCQQLQSSLNGAVDRFFFACKSNDHPSILSTVYECGFGFECVSMDEVRWVKQHVPQAAKDRFLFTPNFCPPFELQQALDHCQFVNIDNATLLVQCRELLAGKDIILRVDPGEGGGHHAKVVTAGERSKFGVTIAQLREIAVSIDRDEALHLADPAVSPAPPRVIGLHVHKGSGITDHGMWSRTAESLASLRPLFSHLKFIDLGGGFAIPYRDSDVDIDWIALRQALMQLRSEPQLQGLDLWVEPGRWVVAECGILLARVTQLKHKPGRCWSLSLSRFCGFDFVFSLSICVQLSLVSPLE